MANHIDAKILRASVLFGTLSFLATSCGYLVDPAAYKGDPLVLVDAQVTGDFSPREGTKAALRWARFDDGLPACMADIPDFEAPLLETNEEQARILQGLRLCAVVHESTRLTTADAQLELAFPPFFQIPVYDLPPYEVLNGGPEGWLGVATIEVYVDGNENGTLDTAPIGVDRWHDEIVGTSDRGERLSADFLIFREGALPPMWKLVSGLYGCTSEPPPGYSLLHVELTSTGTEIVGQGCETEAAIATVVLEDSLPMRRRVCEPQPELGRYTRTEGAPPVHPDDVAVCTEDDVLFYLTEDADLCPGLGRYDEFGCTDQSSVANCLGSFFDDSEAMPGWWSCDGVTITEGPDTGDATSALDVLAQFTILSGATSFSEISAEVERPNGSFGELAVTYFDLDGSGFPSAGDEIEVQEPEDWFNGNSEFWLYSLMLRVGGEVVFETEYAPR